MPTLPKTWNSKVVQIKKLKSGTKTINPSMKSSGKLGSY